MASFIDKKTGSINLSNEWVLVPGLSVESLHNLIGARVSGSDGKTRWFSHILVESRYGQLDLTLNFDPEFLTSVKINLKTEFKTSEASKKTKHDQMLTSLLGPPTSEKSLVSSEIVRMLCKTIRYEWPKLAKEVTWEFPWGSVVSTVDMHNKVAEFWLMWNANVPATEKVAH